MERALADSMVREGGLGNLCYGPPLLLWLGGGGKKCFQGMMGTCKLKLQAAMSSGKSF